MRREIIYSHVTITCDRALRRGKPERSGGTITVARAIPWSWVSGTWPSMTSGFRWNSFHI